MKEAINQKEPMFAYVFFHNRVRVGSGEIYTGTQMMEGQLSSQESPDIKKEKKKESPDMPSHFLTLIAMLLDSVAPLVKMISRGSAPIRDATCCKPRNRDK